MQADNIPFWRRFPLVLSLVLYGSALAFPGYYLGPAYEPSSGLEILLSGWLGPLDGHFAWYANFCWFLAMLNYRNSANSASFAFFGLLLGLSFLLYHNILISEAPSYKDINAIGWGYALWMAAIVTLLIGQMIAISEGSNKTARNVSILTSIAVLGGYLIYYTSGPDSLYAIRRARIQLLSAECAQAGEKIYATGHPAKGIYLVQDYQNGFIFGSRDKTKLIGIETSILGQPLLHASRLDFYEVSNPDDGAPYKIFERGHGVGQPIEALTSEYTLATIRSDIPQRYNMITNTVWLVDRESGRPIASYRYTIDRENMTLCAGKHPYDTNARFVLKHLIR